MPALRERLRDPDASVRFQAATALGRIGEPSAIPALRTALEEPDLFVRYAVFTALHRIGTNKPSAWQPSCADWKATRRGSVAGTTFAVRETYDEPLLTALVNSFRDTARSTPTDSLRWN